MQTICTLTNSLYALAVYQRILWNQISKNPLSVEISSWHGIAVRKAVVCVIYSSKVIYYCYADQKETKRKRHCTCRLLDLFSISHVTEIEYDTKNTKMFVPCRLFFPTRNTINSITLISFVQFSSISNMPVLLTWLTETCTVTHIHSHLSQPNM